MGQGAPIRNEGSSARTLGTCAQRAGSPEEPRACASVPTKRHEGVLQSPPSPYRISPGLRVVKGGTGTAGCQRLVPTAVQAGGLHCGERATSLAMLEAAQALGLPASECTLAGSG